MSAIEQLETALGTYDGTVLLVTHDRVMLEKFGATQTIEVVHGMIRERNKER
jgi:ATPase subunit of ABC transporter with duplicated ATPase domains